MKKLTYSLIVAVIFSVIGLGWVFSTVYQVLSEKNEQPKTQFSVQEEFGRNLASLLEMSDSPEELVDTWNENSDYIISIQEQSYFPIPEEISSNFKAGEALFLKSDSDFSIHFFMPKTASVLSLYLPESADDSGVSWINLLLTFGFYLGIVFIVLVWLYPLIKRLSALRKTARQFGEGDLKSRILPSKITYIADIEREFNHMADRIQTLLSDNKLLSRAVSHDLKTPLARLRFGVDTLSEIVEGSKHTKYIERIQNDLTEMESLVETLLKYARLDQSYIELNREQVELNSFLRELFESYDSAGLNFKLSLTDEECLISGDKNYLAMLFKNLMSNAQRYANSALQVTLVNENNRPVVSFEDDGKGFSDDALASAKQPFWRDNNQDVKSGHGMGLAIVDRIAQWHKAELTLASSDNLHGAKVELSFG